MCYVRLNRFSLSLLCPVFLYPLVYIGFMSRSSGVGLVDIERYIYQQRARSSGAVGGSGEAPAQITAKVAPLFWSLGEANQKPKIDASGKGEERLFTFKVCGVLKKIMKMIFDSCAFWIVLMLVLVGYISAVAGPPAGGSLKSQRMTPISSRNRKKSDFRAEKSRLTVIVEIAGTDRNF